MTEFQPFARTPRGFAIWADFTDLYGQTFSVQQSSLADQDAVWIGVGETRGHLSVEMAEHVRDALNAFIEASES